MVDLPKSPRSVARAFPHTCRGIGTVILTDARRTQALLPPVTQPVNVRDRHLGKLFLGDTLQASDVHAVHLADWSVITNAEGTDAAVFAKEVLVLLVLKRYWVISCSPASKRKLSGLATATQNRFLLQMEQLHLYVLTVSRDQPRIEPLRSGNSRCTSSPFTHLLGVKSPCSCFVIVSYWPTPLRSGAARAPMA